MAKKAVLILLVLTIFCSTLTPVSAAQTVTETWITVSCNDTKDSYMVLQDDKGVFYVPYDWMTFFGLLRGFDRGDYYEFCLPEQELLESYSKRIFIDKKNKTYSVKVYVGNLSFDEIFQKSTFKKLAEDGFTKDEWAYVCKVCPDLANKYKNGVDRLDKGYVTVAEGKFSNIITHEKKLYYPLSELLPLMGAHVDIVGGELLIRTPTVSVWNALTEHNMSAVNFDADEECFGEEITSPLSYVTSALVDKRWECLDVIGNTAHENDYEDIFKGYLVDNEKYLELFNGTNEVRKQKLENTKKTLGDIKTVMDFYNNHYDMATAAKLSETFLNKNFKLNTSSGYNAASDIINAAVKIYDYYYVYQSQIDDHRKMLSVTYDYYASLGDSKKERDKRKTYPSYIAAHTVTDLYGNTTSSSETLHKQVLEDFFTELTGKVVDATVFATIKPAAVTYDVVTNIMKTFGSYDELKDQALLSKADKVCGMAYDCYYSALCENKFDQESLERIRLIGLMSLLSSKSAFEKYASLSKYERSKIDEMLVDYYLAAESVELEGASYIKDKTKSLKAKEKKLEASVKYDIRQFAAKPYSEVAAMKWDVWERSQESYYEDMDDYYLVKAKYKDYSFEMIMTTHDNSEDPANWHILDVSLPENPPIGTRINEDIVIGMTYSQIKKLIQVDYFTEYNDGKAAFSYHPSDTECDLTFYYEWRGNDYVLVNATAQFNPWQ